MAASAEDVLDATEAEDEKVGIELPYSLTSYGIDFDVPGILQRFKAGNVRLPHFQRKYVWKQNQASRFIESLLLGLPVPGIFLAKEEGSEDFLVVDGQQRLRSIQMFFDGEYVEDPLDPESRKEPFTLEGVTSQFEGKTIETLPPVDRKRLQNAILHATVVKKDKPEEDSSIYSLFERINTGGVLLQPQEIRACIYFGALSDLLVELNDEPNWRAVFGSPSPRLKDQELVLRFFTLFYRLDKYERPMKEALNRYMRWNRHLEKQSASELSGLFRDTVAVAHDAIGSVVFRPEKALNAAVFDAVMVGLAHRIRSKGRKPGRNAVREAYDGLLASKKFRDAYKKSTADEEQVKLRVRLAKKAFEET